MLRKSSWLRVQMSNVDNGCGIMKIDIRILAVVSCFIVIAASAVIIVRTCGKNSDSFLVERIPPRGVAMTDRVSGGLELQVDAKGLSLTLSSCDTNNFREKFFLHVYTIADYDKHNTEFINMDFDLTKEKGREILSNGTKKSVFIKRFGNQAAKAVSIGQFTTPNGRCCDITWSRFFLFDAVPRDK
jgi:hypothetical protein